MPRRNHRFPPQIGVAFERFDHLGKDISQKDSPVGMDMLNPGPEGPPPITVLQTGADLGIFILTKDQKLFL